MEICRRLDGIPLAIELAASRMASMTASEVRDRLDHRFRLLVGSRRGLERHQTLRHAVQWSYDLLDDAEKTLLARCSVFAGGFDLAQRLRGRRVPTTSSPPWICSTRWCASRCWSPTGHRGGPGFRCWRRSASSPKNNSSPSARPTKIRAAHSRYFAGREADILALWDSPRQREAYEWFTVELANLRTAFRWAADHGDLDCRRHHRHLRGVSRCGRNSSSRSAGPKNSSNPLAPSTIRGSAAVRDGVRCFAAGRIDDGGRLQRGRAGGHRQRSRERCRSASRSCLALSTLEGRARTLDCEWCRNSIARAPSATSSSRVRLVDDADARRGTRRGDGSRGRPIERRPRHGAILRSSASRSTPTAAPSATPIPSRALDAASGPGDRAGQRQPLRRVAPGGSPGRREGEHGDPWPRSITSRWRSATIHDSGNTTMMPRPLAVLASFSTGSDATNRRPPSAGFASHPSRHRRSRNHHRDRPPARGPRRPDLRIARPQGRDDDHRRHGRRTHTTKSTRPAQS